MSVSLKPYIVRDCREDRSNETEQGTEHYQSFPVQTNLWDSGKRSMKQLWHLVFLYLVLMTPLHDLSPIKKATSFKKPTNTKTSSSSSSASNKPQQGTKTQASYPRQPSPKTPLAQKPIETYPKQPYPAGGSYPGQGGSSSGRVSNPYPGGGSYPAGGNYPSGGQNPAQGGSSPGGYPNQFPAKGNPNQYPAGGVYPPAAGNPNQYPAGGIYPPVGGNPNQGSSYPGYGNSPKGYPNQYPSGGIYPPAGGNPNQYPAGGVYPPAGGNPKQGGSYPGHGGQRPGGYPHQYPAGGGHPSGGHNPGRGGVNPNQGQFPYMAPGYPAPGGYPVRSGGQSGGYPGGYPSMGGTNLNWNPNNKILSPRYGGGFSSGPGYGGSPFSHSVKNMGYAPSVKSKGFAKKAILAAGVGAMAGMAVGYGIGRFPRPHFQFTSPQEEHYYNHYMQQRYGVKSTDQNDYRRDYAFKPPPKAESYEKYMNSCMNRTDLLHEHDMRVSTAEEHATKGNSSGTSGIQESSNDEVSITEIGYPALIQQIKARRCVELYMVYSEGFLQKQTGEVPLPGHAQARCPGLLVQLCTASMVLISILLLQ